VERAEKVYIPAPEPALQLVHPDVEHDPGPLVQFKGHGYLELHVFLPSSLFFAYFLLVQP
jgi:hypothetical protein